jgi:hypothetical protein
VKRLIPQPLVVVWCWMRFRHATTSYEAVIDGVGLVVHTCRCGRRQHAQVLAANRKIRRHVGG